MILVNPISIPMALRIPNYGIYLEDTKTCGDRYVVITEKQSHAVLGSSHKSDTLEMTGRGSVDNISIRSMLKYVKDYDGNDGVNILWEFF